MAEIMDFWHNAAAKAVPNASQTFFFDNSATSRPVEAPPLPAGGSFSIPVHLRDLPVADLPLSGRLVRVLDRIGVVRLGDVDGLSFRDMQCARNCGPGTVLELAKFIGRAAKEQYDAPKDSRDPAELARTIDGIIEGLPSRDKDMLLLRLGGSGEEGLTLSETGARYQITRERVRQVVNRCIERIRTGGSPGLQTYLAYVEEVCRK